MNSSSLQIIDVAPLFDESADLTAKQAVGEEMVAAAESLGFLLIKNYPILPSEIKSAFGCAKDFFAQSIIEKQKIGIKKSNCHRGYFSIGVENLDPQKQKTGDFKEGIKIGQDLPLTHPRVVAELPLHGPNQWPDNPQFVDEMKLFYQTLSDMSLGLLHGLSLGLSLPADYFDKSFQLPMATLAPLRYPPINNGKQADPQSEGSLSAGAHTDFGCLTLVFQDDVAGLQVKTIAGDWIDVPVIEGTVVVNIGDMLQRWSNDRLRSTWHRVINNSDSDRYSMAFFYDPEFDTVLDCLPSCQSAEQPYPYEVITALDYLLQRIAETFSYYEEAS